MPEVRIENQVLNVAFEEMGRHWKFGDGEIADEVVEERWGSAYVVPIAQLTRRGQDKQLTFDTEGTGSQRKPNKLTNHIRRRIEASREGDMYKTTRNELVGEEFSAREGLR